MERTILQQQKVALKEKDFYIRKTGINQEPEGNNINNK